MRGTWLLVLLQAGCGYRPSAGASPFAASFSDRQTVARALNGEVMASAGTSVDAPSILGVRLSAPATADALLDALRRDLESQILAAGLELLPRHSRSVSGGAGAFSIGYRYARRECIVSVVLAPDLKPLDWRVSIALFER